MGSSLFGALVEVLLVNLVLSGDNAVVIGLAARGLPPASRQRAILLGGGFAVLLRLALTLPAEFLLQVPFLRAGGGLLLAWVAYRLLTTNGEQNINGEAATISTAIRLIVLADLTMSLDNILAVAAVAERSDHNVLVLIVGLALSIPIVLLGGNVIARMMGRLPILVWIGAAVLGYTAGELVREDKGFESLFDRVRFGNILVPLLFTAIILGVAYLRRQSENKAKVISGIEEKTNLSAGDLMDQKEAAQASLTRGLGCAVLAGMISLISYTLASNEQSRFYPVFWGGIAWGVFMVARAAFMYVNWLRNSRK